ncbi:MAG: hypothetical protein ACI9K1_001964 [Arcticibacterium sp.]|jgi:hypothetical protein
MVRSNKSVSGNEYLGQMVRVFLASIARVKKQKRKNNFFVLGGNNVRDRLFKGNLEVKTGYLHIPIHPRKRLYIEFSYHTCPTYLKL